jgi:glucose-1-phosphate thymidylyltransferase
VALKGVILVPEAPADGPGSVSTRPPALQPVANSPIVTHVFGALRDAGVQETVVVAPANVSATVQECMTATSPVDAAIRYVVHEDGQSAAAALSRTAEAVGEGPCIVHLADGLLGQPLTPLVDSLQENHTDLLLLLVAPGDHKAEPLGSAARRLLRIADLDPAKTALGCAGVCLAGTGALRRASATATAADTRFDLHAVTEGLATTSGCLDVQVVRGWRRYAGDAIDLLELNRIMLDMLAADFDLVELDDNRIEGRVSIHPSAHVRSSAIVGPVIVGPHAHVIDAYVGPYTSIGAGARIEGVEVERSIISPGASITHLGGRVVASVVGSNARIFRDFSLPRAMRLSVGDNVEVALS